MPLLATHFLDLSISNVGATLELSSAPWSLPPIHHFCNFVAVVCPLHCSFQAILLSFFHCSLPLFMSSLPYPHLSPQNLKILFSKLKSTAFLSLTNIGIFSILFKANYSIYSLNYIPSVIIPPLYSIIYFFHYTLSFQLI